MSNVTVQKLGDAAQADNEPHRLDYIRRDQYDKTISTRLSPAEIRTYGAVGFTAFVALLIVLALLRTAFCWNVPDYIPSFGCTASTTLFWLWIAGGVATGVIVPMALLWGHIRRTQAETYRARITRDRWSNPIDAYAVLSKTSGDLLFDTLLAAKSEIAMAPYKQYPAGLDSLSVSHAAPHTIAELTDSGRDAGSTVLATSDWLAALEESPHLLIYGPSKAGKSTIAQAVVASFGNSDYVVIDPLPNKPGESKWGGIDFVTLCDTGDETASIKTALERIIEEDSNRRANMRSIVPTPLIVIIDEVLGLVDMLGAVKDSAGKTETRISRFIRTMGASARHRGIKIILIGQGKNLVDLGLNSGTARNNYALIRAERNPATNERAAYIVTPDGEQAIDVREVPSLANRATQSARVWLTQTEALSSQRPIDTQGIYNAVTPSVDSSLAQRARDKTIVALFARGFTYDQVRDYCRKKGIAVDQNRFPELRTRALTDKQ